MTAVELGRVNCALDVLRQAKLIPADLCVKLSKTLEQREELRRKLSQSLKEHL